jgi:hypothetical protein
MIFKAMKYKVAGCTTGYDRRRLKVDKQPEDR